MISERGKSGESTKVSDPVLLLSWHELVKTATAWHFVEISQRIYKPKEAGGQEYVPFGSSGGKETSICSAQPNRQRNPTKTGKGRNGNQTTALRALQEGTDITRWEKLTADEEQMSWWVKVSWLERKAFSDPLLNSTVNQSWSFSCASLLFKLPPLLWERNQTMNLA